MARHASAEHQRRLATWPIVIGVVVLLVAGLTVAYFLVVNASDRTAACTGTTVLPVIASPGAGRAVDDAAAAFNATTPVARSTCVTVAVTVLPGATAATALAAGWTDQKTSAPGLWVVDSASDVATLDAADSAMTAGHTQTPLATSPVVLAVRAAPTGKVSWSGLAAGSAGLALAVPDPVQNRASGYGLQAMIAATASATGLDAAAVAAAAPTLTALAAAVPVSPPTTDVGLGELAAGTGGFTAVPVVESELAAFNTAHPPGLTAVYPTGPGAGDEIMAIPLTAGWVSAAVSDAAAAFDAFLGDAKGTAIFTADHLRTSTTPTTTVAGVDLGAPVTALPEVLATVRTTIDSAWTSALATTAADPATTAAGPATTAADPASTTVAGAPAGSVDPAPGTTSTATASSTAAGSTTSTAATPSSTTSITAAPTAAG